MWLDGQMTGDYQLVSVFPMLAITDKVAPFINGCGYMAWRKNKDEHQCKLKMNSI